MLGFYDVFILMPLKDCGHCGWPSCSVLARRMIVGESRPGDCVYLNMPEYADNKARIDELLLEGVKIGVRMPTGSEKLTLIRPCTTESGKCTAMARFMLPLDGKELRYGFFDPFVLCGLLKGYSVFDDVRCSEKMGVARITYDGRSILLFGNGGIKVRKAMDEGDVYATIGLLSRLMWGSVVCPECGCDVVDCASGGCPSEDCSVLGAFPVLDVEETARVGWIDDSKIFERVEGLKTLDVFMDGLGVLDDALADFIKMIDGGGGVDLGDFGDKMSRISLDFIVRTEKLEDACLGLFLLGVARDLKRAFEAASSISSEEDLLSDAVELVTYGYGAFRDCDLEKAGEVEDGYKKLSKKMRGLDVEKSHLLELEKMAKNGHYMARILGLSI